MHFIVDRKTWLRGAIASKLLMHDGKRCCVGFRCQAAGIPDEALINVGSVRSIGLVDQQSGALKTAISQEDFVKNRAFADPEGLELRTLLPAGYSDLNAVSEKDTASGLRGTAIGMIYATNDDPDITDELREDKLKVLFEELGDTVEFIN